MVGVASGAALVGDDVFDAAVGGFIAIGAEDSSEMPLGVGQGKTSVGQAEHTA